MIPTTATQMFAAEQQSGDSTCFYCGGKCDRSHSSRKFVKPSFTALDSVSLSDWVCRGCVVAMGEKATITLADGEIREGQKVRGYSWIITGSRRTACTKRHRQAISDSCTEPPPAPFVICISDSGQKHLLYRAIVNHIRDVVTVTLEGEAITYRPDELTARIELCKQVAAATGKPALKSEMSPQSLMRLVEYHDSDNVLAAWRDCFLEPLTRLAAWLCPPKAECEIEYPAITTANADHKHGRAQATFSWLD